MFGVGLLALAGALWIVTDLAAKGVVTGSLFVFQIVTATMIAGCILGITAVYNRSRPIFVTAEGITALLWFKRKQFFRWKDVVRIEQVRYFDRLASRDRSNFIFLDYHERYILATILAISMVWFVRLIPIF
ncbi:MAG: hypothetical protein WDM81_14180 [Rhizomicrobium sp.]